MKKTAIILSIILLVVFSLFGIKVVPNNKEQKKPGYESLLASNNDKSSISQQSMLQIKDVLIGSDYHIALCEDKTVWSWGENSNGKLGTIEKVTKEPQKIADLNNIKKIIDGGSAIYALTEDGNILAWGANSFKLISPSESADTLFLEPIKLKGLTQIIDLDVLNNKAFALDVKGNMYVWGMYLYGYNGYEDSIFNSTPGFPQEYQYLTRNVTSIIAGSGNYHYFIRKDGTAFSLMEYVFEGFREPYSFIFPTKEELNTNIFDTVDNFNIITINENTKMGRTAYYDLVGVTNIEKIASDAYTMFLNKTDGSLWYWNSDRIKYHDNCSALYNQNDESERCGGSFIEVAVGDILKMKEQEPTAQINNMKSGKENVLFLTDNGEVFVSYYETYTTEDVEFYNPNNTNPERTSYTNTIKDMELKLLKFKKMDWEDIVSINSDGCYGFTVVDSEGNYDYLDLSKGISHIE